MAGTIGLEPTTLRLTVGCSTIELRTNILTETQHHLHPIDKIKLIFYV